jgi:hypothetical protein
MIADRIFLGRQNHQPMDEQAFLQRLCELSLEEGRTFMRDHYVELPGYASISTLIADEARLQREINPSTSFKLAELLIFFGEYTNHPLSHACPWP